jgi:hypothetical protein
MKALILKKVPRRPGGEDWVSMGEHKIPFEAAPGDIIELSIDCPIQFLVVVERMATVSRSKINGMVTLYVKDKKEAKRS